MAGSFVLFLRNEIEKLKQTLLFLNVLYITLQWLIKFYVIISATVLFFASRYSTCNFNTICRVVPVAFQHLVRNFPCGRRFSTLRSQSDSLVHEKHRAAAQQMLRRQVRISYIEGDSNTLLNFYVSPMGGSREKYLGARQTVDALFSRRPENIGQNYQINHSNPQKNAPFITVCWFYYWCNQRFGGAKLRFGGGQLPRPTPQRKPRL